MSVALAVSFKVFLVVFLLTILAASLDARGNPLVLVLWVLSVFAVCWYAVWRVTT